MPSIIAEATYENGILRLDRPIDLADGTRVEVIVATRPETPSASTSAEPGVRRKTPAELAAEIASMAMESDPDGFSGRDHDRILYGGPDGVR